MEYQVCLCIFQKNSAMATYGLKEMGKFLWEGREKGVRREALTKEVLQNGGSTHTDLLKI